MRRKHLLISGIILIGISLLVLKFTGQQSQTCVEYTNSFTENFDTIQYKDEPNCSVAHWPSGPITLRNLGSNFDISTPQGMGGQIFTCDAGDFDGDGKPDLIGLEINPNGNIYRCRLLLIRNVFYDGDGDGVDDDGILFQIDTSKIFETFNLIVPADTIACGITVGDYNGDGLLDFFFAKNNTHEFLYFDFLAVMYINQGTKTNPVFYPSTDSRNLNFTQVFKNNRIYVSWTSNHFCSVDIDKDGDIDILAGSQDKIFLMRNPLGGKSFVVSNWEVKELNYNQRTGYNRSPDGTANRGTSCVAAGDFDGDGDIDIVCGSVNNWNFLVYYQNDGTGRFVRSTITIPDSRCYGPTGLAVAYFKNDGKLDIFGATDSANTGGSKQARMWIFRNKGADPVNGLINWGFTCLDYCNPILPPTYDCDICVPINYDSDEDMDVVLADGNHSRNYYLLTNDLAPVYTLYGQAVSTNVVANLIDPEHYAITKARIINLNQGVMGSPSGLKITYYLSNNGGDDWELYKTFEGTNIKSFSDSNWHVFNHFGADLRWKAVLEAPEDQMADYSGASFDTPYIGELTIEFTYIGPREYSRSSVATSVIDRSGQNRKLIIAASFIYPSWEGHLRAYDVTGMTAIQNSYSTLRTVTSSDLSSPSGRYIAEGVELLWDAGELLKNRSADSRKIYTAIKNAGLLERIEFNVANVDLLRDELRDSQNDPEGLIQFVRGVNRSWKLGDINHSTPIVVGPPKEDPKLMGNDYDKFKEALSSRRKVIYVGANDGMLHCFDVSSGEELWGYIPYNLLPKLTEMWPVKQSSGTRRYQRRPFVDSSPSVADVYINFNGQYQWRTVLICGQGEGFGQSIQDNINNKNYYYFALDITDPENPIPMWEFVGDIVHHGQYDFATNGQTWSVPYIAKVNLSSGPTWVAFVGSGPAHPDDANNPINLQYIGNTFAAIKIDDGSLVWSQRIRDLDSSDPNNSPRPFKNIYVSFQGSPNGVDLERDGYVDYVYIGDLDGRIWRLNTTSGIPSSWQFTEIYRDRCLYPIITKPAIWSSTRAIPRIYFGTGANESAPADRTYSFVALLDDGKSTSVEWFMGSETETGLPVTKKVGSLEAGEKVWADPVISDYIVYFSTLKGSIEAADPCQNLGDPGRLYARFIQPIQGQLIGGSALKNAQGQSIDYLQLASKARTAVTVGDRERAGSLYKRDIYVQEYNSTIEKLEQPVGGLLRIKSWREIYQIIR